MTRVSLVNNTDDQCVSIKILQTTSGQKTAISVLSMSNYNSLLLCRLTVTIIIIFYGVFYADIGHLVGAAANNDTQRHPNRLMPRFLNGHYVTWPSKDDGMTSYCDADSPAPKPPPHIYYVPDNVVFTRMQMAGDRAFIVSPRYKYVNTC